MNPTNAEIVRHTYEAWNCADWDGVFAAFAPDIQVDPPALWPEAGPIRGRDNVRRAFEAAAETSQRLPPMEVGEVLDVGPLTRLQA